MKVPMKLAINIAPLLGEYKTSVKTRDDKLCGYLTDKKDSPVDNSADS